MIELLIQNKFIFLAVAFSLIVSAYFVVKYFLKLSLFRRESKAKGFLMQIIPPKYNHEETNSRGYRFAVQRFMDNLTACISKHGVDRASFEIHADSNSIRFIVWTNNKKIQNLIKLNLFASYQDRVQVKEIENDFLSEFDDAVINEFQQKKHFIYPLMDLKDFDSVDPVQAILSSMSNLKDSEKAVVQIVLKPTQIDKLTIKRAKENFRLGKSEINWSIIYFERIESYLAFFIPLLPFALIKVFSAVTKTKSEFDPMSALPDSDPRKVMIEQDEMKDFSNHLAEKFKTPFIGVVRVAISNSERSEEILDGINQSFENLKTETQNRFIRKPSKLIEELITRFIYPVDDIFPFYTQTHSFQSIYSSRELSMLYHLPQTIPNPNIEHYILPEIPATKVMKQKLDNSDLFLGINKSKGKETNVYLSSENRKRHIVVTGQTGTGKSTILKKFVLQDIDNRLLFGTKRGLMLLDPHEDFFSDILERIPKNSLNTKSLIAWDTQDESFYFGFNPLFALGMSEREIDLVVDSNFKLIEKTIMRTNLNNTMGATGKPMLINAMKTLMVFQNEWLKKHGNTKGNIELITKYAPTLIDVKSIFSSIEMETTVLSYIPFEKYEDLRSFWNETLPTYRDSKNWQEIKQGFDNKLSQILTGILLYTFGQSKNSIEISSIIRDSKILLVNLASQNIGEEGMSLLGSLLMSKVWFESKRIKLEERNSFVVYADEFQNFANSDFATALSEARKFKLELILAHQFFRQLPDGVFHAVMGNVKSKIYYRCGVEDAPVISKELQNKILEQEAVEIPEFHANVKVGEEVLSIYVSKERDKNLSYLEVDKFIQNSYERYAMEKSEIEKLISERRTWLCESCKLDLQVLSDVQ